MSETERTPYDLLLTDGMHIQYTAICRRSKLPGMRVDLDYIRKVINTEQVDEIWERKGNSPPSTDMFHFVDNNYPVFSWQLFVVVFSLFCRPTSILSL